MVRKAASWFTVFSVALLLLMGAASPVYGGPVSGGASLTTGEDLEEPSATDDVAAAEGLEDGASDEDPSLDTEGSTDAVGEGDESTADAIDASEPDEGAEQQLAGGGDLDGVAGEAQEPEGEVEADATLAEDDALSAQATVPKVQVQAHVQSIGWQAAVGDGVIAGTSGKSLRVEALKLSIAGKDLPEGSIEYRAHVQSIGWQDWVKDGEIAGTSGKSLRIEALKIRLTGELAEQYDVYYQVHVQKLGWMALASNGEASGSAGHSYRVEALRVWLVEKGAPAPETTCDYAKSFYGVIGLTVQAHVQKVGWQAAVGSGSTAGTTGRSLRVEALRLSVSGLEESGGIEYRAHVQSIGWQSWKKNGEIAGTTGKGLRVEAFQARLTGDLAENYDLYYRAHVQCVGWLSWAKAGETAGSEGMSMRVEALQFKLVKKGSAAPSDADAAYAKPCVAKASVGYAAWVQNATDWQATVKDGATSGTTGQALYVEGIRMAVSGDDGSITYRACLPDGSWTSWLKDGNDLLTSGKRIEGIQIKLSGEVSKAYDVWYRAHVQNVGWTGWTKNGASAGSTGLNFRIEAYQVRLVSKAAAAPGETYRPYVTKDNLYDAMTKKAQGYSSLTNYLIMIDTSNCYLGVYRGSKGSWTRIQYWRCSTGASSTPTILGAFNAAYYKTEWFGHTGEYRCWYATQISGNYLIHSVLYTDDSSQSTFVDGRLGKHISQGCVRLDIKNAKWIYSNIPAGTKIVTY